VKYFYYLIISILIISNKPLFADEIILLGKKVFFGSGNCSSCHVLTDEEGNGEVGQNLNQIKPDIYKIISSVNNGVGVMPSYKGILSSEEIESVAIYVYKTINK